VLDSNFERRLDNKFHDAHEGEITSVIINKDENMFLSSAKDGLIYIFKFDKKCSFNEIKKDLLAGVEGVNFMAKDDKEALRRKKQLQFWDENPPIFVDAEE
jgi:WD40 repeat protein